MPPMGKRIPGEGDVHAVAVASGAPIPLSRCSAVTTHEVVKERKMQSAYCGPGWVLRPLRHTGYFRESERVPH